MSVPTSSILDYLLGLSTDGTLSSDIMEKLYTTRIPIELVSGNSLNGRTHSFQWSPTGRLISPPTDFIKSLGPETIDNQDAPDYEEPMKWSDIKMDAYKYLYGMEEKMSEALKEKIRASLERQLDILQTQLWGTVTNQMEPNDHDGPTIDLGPADYSHIEDRVVAWNLDQWGSAAVRRDRRVIASTIYC